MAVKYGAIGHDQNNDHERMKNERKIYFTWFIALESLHCFFFSICSVFRYSSAWTNCLRSTRISEWISDKPLKYYSFIRQSEICRHWLPEYIYHVLYLTNIWWRKRVPNGIYQCHRTFLICRISCSAQRSHSTNAGQKREKRNLLTAPLLWKTTSN